MNASKAQRWRHGRHRWARDDIRLDPSRYTVTELSLSDARAFVLTHHYSGTYPADRLRFGLVDHATGDLAGVAVLSIPAHKNVLSGVFPDLEPYTQSVELGRFVLLDSVPGNGETWFLSRVFTAVHDRGVRGVVSFSDPQPRITLDGRLVLPGHVGYIYQACNGIYTGRGAARRVLVLPDGRSLSARALAKVRAHDIGHRYVIDLLVGYGATPPDSGEPLANWLPGAIHAAQVRSVAHRGCHRYAFPLGRSARDRRRVAIANVTDGFPKAPDPAPAYHAA